MIVVLGHYPAYVELATRRGHRHFSVDAADWESWTVAVQWAANREFLDSAIAAGAGFLLATPPAEARSGSWFARELDYLRASGYQARYNGVEWELFR